MPFTPAHPAIILPLLKRTRFSAIGLVIGSMSPDFEYFFKMRVNSTYSHTVGGLLYFDLPVTILLSWVFIRFVKHNLIANLPMFLQRRLQAVAALDARRVLIDRGLIFLISAVIGSMSHLFWDGFTHNGTFFVTHLSIYEGTYVPYDGVKYPLWYAMQHISTVIGLTAVIGYILRLPDQPCTLLRPSLAYWFVLLGTAAIVVIIRFQIWPYDHKEGNIIVTSISGICCGLVVAGLIRFNNAVQEAIQKNG